MKARGRRSKATRLHASHSESGERAALASSSIAGALGVFSSWNVCHSACLAVVGLFAFLGLASPGLPFLFLQPYAPLLWGLGLLVFFVTTALTAAGRMCMSRRSQLFNLGVLFAAAPFAERTGVPWLFWIAGGAMVVAAAVWYARNRFRSGTTAGST